MHKCLHCYQPLEENQVDYHPACATSFFGMKHPPLLPYQLGEMDELARQVAMSSISVPGVQPKLSIGWLKAGLKNGHQGRLTIMNALDGHYILKPPHAAYPQMPENEHLSMKLAELFGIQVVPVTLIRLASNERCFLTKRIDRNADGSKNHQIDFLQILELEDKYKGTMEMLGKKIGALSANPLLDKLRFFESTVFNYVIGNNDMHLKNYSMCVSEMGWVLTPLYDLINVKLILPKDKEDMALMLGGKKENFRKVHFDQLAEVLQLNKKQIQVVYRRLQKWIQPAITLINQSFLDSVQQQAYIDLIVSRTNQFLLDDKN